MFLPNTYSIYRPQTSNTIIGFDWTEQHTQSVKAVSDMHLPRWDPTLSPYVIECCCCNQRGESEYFNDCCNQRDESEYFKDYCMARRYDV
jgi:hypothetical protein